MESRKLRKDSNKDDFVLGRERFALISAVEGITLTAAMDQRAANFESQQLTDEERRAVIVSVHRKG